MDKKYLKKSNSCAYCFPSLRCFPQMYRIFRNIKGCRTQMKFIVNLTAIYCRYVNLKLTGFCMRRKIKTENKTSLVIKAIKIETGI